MILCYLFHFYLNYYFDFTEQSISIDVYFIRFDDAHELRGLAATGHDI
jgi:hypothetical protein